MQAREQIIADVQIALRRKSDSPVAAIPASARIAPRMPGSPDNEMKMLLDEIAKLGGATAQVARTDLKRALEKLVRSEQVKKATLWVSDELHELGIAQTLGELGVVLVSPTEEARKIAECDLGVTSVDYAFPETGTLMLLSSSDKPRAVSLLPRIHLAIVSTGALRADVGVALAEVTQAGDRPPYCVFITGPSRTADIELTVTIGVHGPSKLYTWHVQ